MVMVGHSRNLARPRSTRERRLTLAVTGALVALVVGVVVYFSVHGDSYSSSRNGCVNLTVPSTLGGAMLHRCGAGARAWCREQDQASGELAALVRKQCVLAGLGPARRTP